MKLKRLFISLVLIPSILTVSVTVWYVTKTYNLLHVFRDEITSGKLKKSILVHVHGICFYIFPDLQQQLRRILMNHSRGFTTNSMPTHVVPMRQVTPRRGLEVTTALRSTTVRCPSLKPPVFPLSPHITPPCESDERFYSSPLFCTRYTAKKPLLAILILSHVENFNQREELRKEWVRSTFHMKSDFIAAHPWTYAFVVGRPTGNGKETAEK